MKNILSDSNIDVLREFAWSNVLLAFDFDGTLAPIVDDPGDATMRQETRELLWQLTRSYPVVVISGRAQPDALRRMRGTGVLEVIGNHGIEPRFTASRYIDEVRRWLPILNARVAPFKGVVIEDKIFSVAVHYRRSREKKRARAEIRRAAASLGEVVVIGGKLVVNILPKGAPHKGIALESARERLRCDTALYVGDDESDESVFALDRPGRLLPIRVGARRASAATYYVADQGAVDDLLRALIVHRRAPASREAAH